MIAEGVENQIQKDILARQGCRFFQGYFFGRPQPAQTLTELMEATQGTTAALRP